jgi:SSS family solute:Na+ symporter
VNPFGLGEERNFNIIYWAISAFTLFYAARAWQGDQGYNSAALNAHEARMAQILNGWRYRSLMLVTIIVPLAVRAFLTQPEYADAAAPVHEALAQAPTDAVRAELRTPLAMSIMLPAGVLGLFVAAMLGAAVSTDEAYLHSWGSIFVQDVLLPFRKRPFDPVTHVRLLKLAALGVALFAFTFSLLYEPNQYIAMFAALSASVFVGGAGAAIIGGLYWRRGSVQGAWAAMCTGMGLSAVGVIVQQLSPEALPGPGRWLRENLTGMEMSFVAMMSASAAYVVVSLLGPRTDFNLERMLHRGRWRVEGGAELDAVPRTILEKLGFDRAYTGTDRLVAFVTLAWPLAFTAIFITGTAYALLRARGGNPVSDATWSSWWHGWTWLILGTSVIIVCWFSAGGIRDLIRMYRLLERRRTDRSDDGRVMIDAEAPVGGAGHARD